ncbi:uncharacterized protein [Aegilops tauschii subsp. strangulata]|uniref:uncharacterized protein n=1 Tax=Aegilops tauschii subsp. strangulata TaxID=200361 RepID=UPI003CC8D2B6
MGPQQFVSSSATAVYIDPNVLLNFDTLKYNHLDGCAVLTAVGTRGGVAILWDKSTVQIDTRAVGLFSITAKVTLLQCSSSFWLTTVYGPVDDGLKDSFLAELIHSAPPLGEPWMLAGNFNIIYEARDKSNLNLNRRIMGMFRRAIDTAGLKEIKCKNRRFTWSNERQDPTLVSIDKIFCNVEWESLFPSLMLMAASTACSDHCPLVLADTTAPPRRATFKFEAFWPRFPRFRETLERAWQRPVASTCPIARLNTKLKRAAFDLKIWARSLFSDAKVQLHLAAEVVLRLDIAQEARRLSPAEFCLRKQLKLRIVGLAAIERARKRQASRTEAGLATAHGDKATIAHAHFLQLLGTRRPRSCSINWDSILLPSVENVGIDNPFTETEVWEAIKASPSEKASGPDGFSGAFYRSCWSLIKHDIMAVFHHFYNLAGGDFAALNSAMIVLLPKKDGATSMADYRPISLIHSIAKLIAKDGGRCLLSILHLFGEATGLHVNLAKSSAVPISCGDLDLGSILHNFGGSVASLPITYLGLPITTSRVRLVHLQFILDRIRARLAGWKGRLMHIAGRRVLVRCVLSAMPTFALTVLRAPKKFFKEVDKARCRFLWAQDEAATRGKCKVAWSAVTTPEPHGGLGIHDLDKFARALRLRWLWLSWTHPEQPWVGTDTPCNLQDRALFAANTAVTIGDGKTASFWSSPWLDGRPLRLDYPTLFARSIRKNRSVRDALLDGRWILDLRHGETSSIAPSVLQLARAIWRAGIIGIIINNDLSDTIRWTAATSGHYSARSAYAAQFQAPMAPFPSKDVWRIWAPGKLKMFLWMLHLDRLWCNNRLQRRGWENSYFCQLCLRNLESSSHLFWDCPIAIQAWTMAASWRGCHSLAHATWSSGTTTTERVRLITDAARPTDRKGTRSILVLIGWHIWLERNACTFRGKTPCSRSIIEACRRDMEQWRIAGAACIEHPFGDVP